MLKISNRIFIPAHEIEQQFIRSQGAGGQHVNKTSTAVHLFFDIRASTSLPAYVKQKLLHTSDHRISASGKIIIKSQASRSQDSNRQTALDQLSEVIKAAMVQEKRRIATKPTKGSKTRRLDSKTQKGHTKKLRSKVQGV
ncbi:alternative ribosome rescue aminoacyl-tRNA hydrolase ArfB [Candidatus Njordibacter sp. Uisw_056]|jgi:ribosome-associated protein|uniref:alternative ribosome rescue aminoacyl-tRNA hydrolase ArfB n=1 Tax=Candidatus Njordibacter sp. Uisw_056 TaxID=3230973 RepID=UPI003D4EFCC6|tara:strand:- start:10462 stop:10881 length:420 start_codon:yes stop_codon:yes gene_type:complete